MMRTTNTTGNKGLRADDGLKAMFARLAAEPVPATILGLVDQLDVSCRQPLAKAAGGS